MITYSPAESPNCEPLPRRQNECSNEVCSHVCFKKSPPSLFYKGKLRKNPDSLAKRAILLCYFHIKLHECMMFLYILRFLVLFLCLKVIIGTQFEQRNEKACFHRKRGPKEIQTQVASAILNCASARSTQES